MRKVLYSLIFYLSVFSLIYSGEVVHYYNLDMPIITQKNGYDCVSLDGCQAIGEPGLPALPAKGVALLLPQGEEVVGVEVEFVKREKIEGEYFISPIQKEYPLSCRDAKVTLPDEAVYSSASIIPEVKEGSFFTQFYRGYSVGYTTAIPFEYIPKSGELYRFNTIKVTMHTKPGSRAIAADALYRSDESTRSNVAKLVDNSSIISQYYSAGSRDTRDNSYDYLIITNADMTSSIMDLVNFKNRTGIKTKVFDVADILINYIGVDDADKIRNFIIEQYTEYGIEYLLLAGDDEILAHRGLADMPHDDGDIPGDVYFSGLDGTWNNDLDNLYGEPNEADLLTELSVGRLAVDSNEEMTNFVNKIIMYQSQPVLSDIETAFMIGEDLGWPMWGSDHKEEVRLGANSWNHTTVGPTENFTIETLYDIDNVWSASGHLLPLLNDGFNLVNHMGHCYVYNAMKLSVGNITHSNFTNNGIDDGFYILYSQGCYFGSFDNRDVDGYHGVNDCIGEHMAALPSGPVAMIINSRYGWGAVSTLDGSSQWYDREFFDAIFGEEITKIGDAQMDSKHSAIPYISHRQNRWCFYCSNLFGDPTMDIWTAQPTELQAEYDDEIFIGTPTTEVTVTDMDGNEVEGALVAFSAGNLLVGSGITGSNGLAAVEISDEFTEPTTLNLIITGHNYQEYNASAQLVLPAQAEFSIDEIPINTETEFTMTVTDNAGDPIEGMECWIDGIGEEYDTTPVTTNAQGECGFTIEYPFGHDLLIRGKMPQEDYDKLHANIPVTGGNTFSDPDISIVNNFNLEDGFVPGIESVVEFNEAGSEYRIWLFDDNNSPIISDEGFLNYTPEDNGNIRILITQDNYNIFEEYFNCHTESGRVSGTITANDTQQPLNGAEVCFFEPGADIDNDTPLFYALTNENGIYEIAEYQNTAYYDFTVKCFGFDTYYEQNFILGIGDGLIQDVVLQRSAGNEIYGQVTNEESTTLYARVSVFRADTGELYAESWTDENGNYSVNIPNHEYSFKVKSTGYLTLHHGYVISGPQNIDFTLLASQGVLIVNGDIDGANNGAQIISESLNALSITNTIENANETDPASWDIYEGIIYVCGQKNGVEALLSDNTYNLQEDILEYHQQQYRTIWVEGARVGLFYSMISDVFRERILHELIGSSAEGDLCFSNNIHPIAKFPNWLPVTIEYSGGNDTKTRIAGTADAELVACWDGSTGTWSSINCANKNTVYTSFIIDNIANDTYRDYLIENIAYYLDYKVAPIGIRDEFAMAPKNNKANLHGNRPNPFNPETVITFDLPKESSGKLNIYNIKGQLIRTLLEGELNQGTTSVVWNGLNNYGQSVSSGIYFYSLDLEGEEPVTRKMILMK